MKIFFLFLIFTIKLSALDYWDPYRVIEDRWINDYIQSISNNPNYPHFDFICNDGIIYSKNNGRTWINSTFIKIDDSLTDCYGKFIFNGLANTSSAILASIKGGSLIVSTNYGDSWDYVEAKDIGDIKTFYIEDSIKIYAGTSTGLFISTDNGYNWLKLNSGLNLDGTIINEIKSNEKGDIYACTKGYIIKFDKEKNIWSITKVDSVTELNINAIAFYNTYIYIGTDSGLYISENEGFSWRRLINNLSDKKITTIESCFGKIFVGTEYYGLYSSSDSGKSWTDYFEFWNQSVARIKRYDDLIRSLFVTGYGWFYDLERAMIFIMEKIDINYPIVRTAFFNKQNWMFHLTESNIYYQNIHPIKMGLPSKKNSLYYGIDSSDNIFYSDFGCPLYKAKYRNGFDWSIPDSNFINVIDIIVGADGSLFALNNLGRVHKSINNGDSWKIIDNLDSIHKITYNRNGSILAVGNCKLNISKDNGNSWDSYLNSFQGSFADSINTYQFKDNSIISATSCGIYYTDDFGATWAQAIGIPCININNIVRASNELYASCDSGIYRSLDLGKSWFEYNNGMPRIKKCKVLNVDKLGYVYVATDFFGVYKSVEPVTSVVENKYLSNLSINPYPNPFSQSTSIKFHLNESSYSSLKIYDIFGNEIETLFSGFLDAGEHIYYWEVSGRANGAYYYRLQAGNEMKTGVVVLD